MHNELYIYNQVKVRTRDMLAIFSKLAVGCKQNM